MADNGVFYGDFSHMDGNTISGNGLNNFGQRADQQNYGNPVLKPGPGFYNDHFMHISGNPSSGQPHNYNSPLNGIGPPQSPLSPHDLSLNHMPITSPTPQSDLEDTKDLELAYPGLHNGLGLAKPVPMRRLSEKRLNQTRAGINTPSDVILESSFPASSPALARALIAVQQTQKRQRSEKKPIPNEHRDTKYYERRHRNNFAAKRSRDSRKAREDEIAIRASFLEKENAILRAQVSTLREEANSLRQLLLQKRSRH